MRFWIDALRELHAFFLRHLFYPILLSSVLALVLFSARVFRSETLIYRNLVWNLFLAWVPFLLSLLSSSLHALRPQDWGFLLIPGALWLIFFPNAPYIITDFLHLEERPGVPLWYDILLLTTFAWTGLFLAAASLRGMQDLVKAYLGKLWGWVFAAMALGLGGLGIFLGRFSRFNSWDLLFQPREVVADIALRLFNPLNNLRFFGFTFLFTAFLLVVYLTFITAHRAGERE